MVRVEVSMTGACAEKSVVSNCCLLSAMRLKQWRVPRVLNCECLRTKSWIAATEFAEATVSVLYSMLPAQFVSFSGDANAEISSGMVAAAVQSLMNVRFFMSASYAHRQKESKNFLSYSSC